MKNNYFFSVLSALFLFFPFLSPLQAPSLSCHSVNGLPDPKCTPGVIFITDSKTLCSSSFTTKSIRPSVQFTNKLKIEQLKQYDYKDKNPKDYEEDHLIPLELGGSPSDTKNLWPEVGDSPNPKDKVENSCRRMVCSGEILLSEAQKEIATNWTTACQAGNQQVQKQQNIIVPLPKLQNDSGNIPSVISSPTNNQTPINGATALCNDGTYSYAAHHQGACSKHGGVNIFYK